jgi:cytochrome b
MNASALTKSDAPWTQMAPRKIWDLPVRVFHWALAAAVTAAFVTNRLGVSYFKYHVWCGYTVIVLVLFRLSWGVIGTRYARFNNFLRGPATTLRYALSWMQGRSTPYAGHNPLGAWMVMFLLAAFLVQALSGLFGNDDILNVGPLCGYVSNKLSLQLTSLHRKLCYWLLAAVAIHVVAVFAHWAVKRENLVLAMITGHKPPYVVVQGDGIESSRTWIAVALIIAFAATLAWIVRHAPSPVTDTSYF